MRARFIGVLGAILALGVLGQAAVATQDFQICCEGTRCGGGGMFVYEYTLMNMSPIPLTLNELCVGTEDPNPASYTFVPTPGFAASVILNDGFPPCNVLYTSGLQTPHGVVPPIASVPSSAVIYWLGSTVVPPGGTIMFAYTHPNAPYDEEWHANSSAGWTIAQSNLPIAGPLGVFGFGYVHGPGPLPVPVEESTWGVIKALYR